MGSNALVVMMSDFGAEHWYDAAMKGEILSRAPHAVILDLSHEVPRHSVEQAAFLLHCALDSFPRQTIFCCVVDPGVGSKRGTLVGWVGDWGFVGPDNGLVSPMLDRAGSTFELHEIKSKIFRNPEVSATFHGRDIFAPATARLLLGDDPRMAGPRVVNPVRLPPIQSVEEDGKVIGKVLLIDHFGNAVTNIDQKTYGERLAKGKFQLSLNSLKLEHLGEVYSDKEKGQALCYWGSSRFLEVAINFGSAAETYGISIGDTATIVFE